MIVRVSRDGIGTKKMYVEMEVECSPEEAKGLIEKCERMLVTLPDGTSQQATPAKSPTSSPSEQFVAPMEEGFEPATDAQEYALGRVAEKMGKTVRQICYEYGFDHIHLSKKAAMKILSDLNKKADMRSIKNSKEQKHHRKIIQIRFKITNKV